jgi:hypothetical protein
LVVDVVYVDAFEVGNCNKFVGIVIKDALNLLKDGILKEAVYV